MYSEPNKPLTGVSKVTGAVALQGWCQWRNGSSLARSSFEHTLFSPLRNTRQAVGQDQSKSVSQLCLVLWPGYEEHLCPPQPPHCILIDTFPTCFYSKALSANTPNHTPLLGFQSPLKIPFYCKSCFVQSCWRPLLTEYYQSENPIFFGGLWSSLLVQAPQRKSLLCDHKQYKQKQPAVTLLNASNFCYFYKSVFYQQLNDADVDNIIYSLMFEELLFL